jgi:transcriptional regulator GlxA family with amidase domain
MENLGVVIYENVQPMDALGPWELLSFWKNTLRAPINMYLISENGSYVQCANDLIIKAHLDFNNSPQLDYLFVPGGPGRLVQSHNETYLSFIRKQAKNAKYIISICTGMFLLHQAGILKNKSATTYWRALPELKAFPDVHIVEKRIVKDGNIWSSGGISSGIDLALELIAEIAGQETAGEVQLLFEYFPQDKVFASLNSIDKLPPYYNTGSKSFLPQYISDYIQSKTKN